MVSSWFWSSVFCRSSCSVLLGLSWKNGLFFWLGLNLVIGVVFGLLCVGMLGCGVWMLVFVFWLVRRLLFLMSVWFWCCFCKWLFVFCLFFCRIFVSWKVLVMWSFFMVWLVYCCCGIWWFWLMRIVSVWLFFVLYIRFSFGCKVWNSFCWWSWLLNWVIFWVIGNWFWYIDLEILFRLMCWWMSWWFVRFLIGWCWLLMSGFLICFVGWVIFFCCWCVGWCG